MKITTVLKCVACMMSALFFSQILFSQTNTFPATGSVGIGTVSPHASAALEISSSTQGILVPRMTQAERDNIATPATGLLIFQTNNVPGFYYYTGIAWSPINSDAANKQLSNLSSSTAINTILQPGVDNALDLGSVAFSWKSLYLDSALYLGGNRFVAYSEGNGEGNTALGASALINNNNGIYNTASGYQSLFSNTNGIKNTATGYQALYSNLTGKKNTASGYKSLFRNTTGNHNAANGYRTLTYNTTGNDNTASGYRALNSNTTGSANSAIGYHALYKNTTSQGNSAFGYRALSSNDTGNANTAMGYGALTKNTSVGNTAVGYNALFSNATGSFNTALGNSASVSSTNFTNATVVGYSAIATASNSIMLGNTSVTSVKAAGSIVIVSDGRFKKNIKSNVPGIEFINALNPITFTYDIHKLNNYIKPDAVNMKEDNDEDDDENTETQIAQNIDEVGIANKEKIVYSGFVAQDVEKAAEKFGYDFSGVYKPQNTKDPYGLSYADFVVPLVKAVQQLSRINDEKSAAIDSMQKQNSVLQKQFNELKDIVLSIQQKLEDCSSCTGAPAQTYNTIIADGALLEQNAPNPFNHSTSIGYTLPAKFVSAQIIIFDKAGKTIRSVNISGSGKGKLNVDAAVLSAGAYNYSLFIDGKLIATKQMILIK